MPGNTTGNIFRLTSFGESHGTAIGGVIDGCPAGLAIDFDFIQNELARRKPGQSSVTSSRSEEDKIEFLSGIYEGLSLGTPIAFLIKNKDIRSSDYDRLKDAFRFSHADYTYQKKYGIRDHRGGGRSSARETVARVVAGAIAKLILNKENIKIAAYVSQVGNIVLEKPYPELNLTKIESNIVRCPDKTVAEQMIKKIEEVKNQGDSIGGTITCIARNVPAGLGEPVFNKLHAELGKAILSINAVKGFEFGSGFNAAYKKGSEHNDEFFVENDKVRTRTNFSGGIQGGISNGEDIYFKAAFKPVATINKEQKTINSKNEVIVIQPEGRHDPCVLPRAVPIVEAMTAIVLTDFLLLRRCDVY